MDKCETYEKVQSQDITLALLRPNQARLQKRKNVCQVLKKCGKSCIEKIYAFVILQLLKKNCKLFAMLYKELAHKNVWKMSLN